MRYFEEKSHLKKNRESLILRGAQNQNIANFFVQMNLPLSRGGGVKLRTQWLPVAASLDNKEASMQLLSLYMGKLMGAGKGVGELKVRDCACRGRSPRFLPLQLS